MTDMELILTIAGSITIAGLVFLILAFYLRKKYSYGNGGIRTEGTLVAFRKYEDYVIDPFKIVGDNLDYEDFAYNMQNSKPLFTFYINGYEYTCSSEWATNELQKEDIGTQIPIICYPHGRHRYRVVLDSGKQRKQIHSGQKLIFAVFFGVGLTITFIGLVIGIILMLAM